MTTIDVLDETNDHSNGWGAPCVPEPDVMATIATTTGRLVPMAAYQFGAWLVHRSVEVNGARCQPDSWAVSHDPSGRSIGLALELTFWEAIRIAMALDDTGIMVGDLSEVDSDEIEIFKAAIGAALNDHYVWPLHGAWSGEPEWTASSSLS
jgi:hypothetical protein